MQVAYAYREIPERFCDMVSGKSLQDIHADSGVPVFFSDLRVRPALLTPSTIIKGEDIGGIMCL